VVTPYRKKPQISRL